MNNKQTIEKLSQDKSLEEIVEIITALKRIAANKNTIKKSVNTKSIVLEAERLAKKKAKEKKKNLSKVLPKYLNPEQMVNFNEWFLKKTGKERSSVKPEVNFKEIIEKKETIINVFSEKIDDWKEARRFLFEHTHPDKGGNEIAFHFVKKLDDLMKELIQLREYGKYKLKMAKYKSEWWDDYTKKDK